MYKGTINEYPQPCPPGAFCLGGVSTSVIDETASNKSMPQLCTAGYYCSLNACDPFGTDQCPKGHFCPAGSPAPVPAPKGSFSDKTRNFETRLCLSGYYADENATVKCKPCPAGYECPAEGTIEPTECAASYYKILDPAIKFCSPCPEGTWTNKTGLQSVDECIICNEGWVCDREGQTVMPETNPDETRCREGFYCPRGANSTTSKSPCPAGYYCGAGVGNSSKYDKKCPAGFFCPPSTSESNYPTNKCPAGYFCPEGLAAIPSADMYGDTYKCPRATTSEVGSKKVRDCYKRCRDGGECEVVDTAQLIDTGSSDPNVFLPALAVMDITVDLTRVYSANNSLGLEMIYDDHYRFAFFLTSQKDQRISKSRQRMPTYFANNINKNDSHVQFRLTALDDVYVNFVLEIMHGLYSPQTAYFKHSATYTLTSANRSDLTATETTQLFAVIEKGGACDMPMNMILDDEEYLLIDYVGGTNNSFVDFLDSFDDKKQAESYWDRARFAQRAKDMITMPFLPFFSSCKGFDSHIGVSYILESEKYCTLPTQEEVVAVPAFNLFSVPTADSCEVTIECGIEEELRFSGGSKRWFELESGETMFYLTQLPGLQSDYASQIHEYFGGLLGTDGLIPVEVESTWPGGEELYIPKTVDIEILYYQETAETKRIISVGITLDNFEKVDNSYVATMDGEGEERLNRYTLTITYDALDWMELMNNFAFGADLYLTLFIILGIAASISVSIFFLFNLITTRIRPRPKFKFFRYFALVTPPPIIGTCLAMLPITLALGVVYVLFVEQYPFENYPGDYGDVLELTVDRIEKYKIGRLGGSLLCMALFIMCYGSILFVPEKASMGDANHLWTPAMWKRAHMIFLAIFVGTSLVWVLEFSYSDWFSNYVLECIFMFKIVQMILDVVLLDILGEGLLLCPIMVGVATAEFLVTMGADNFMDFLVSYFIELVIIVVERIYMDPLLKFVHAKGHLWFTRFRIQMTKQRGLLKATNHLHMEIRELKEIQDAKTIEPMLDSYAVFCNETMSLYLSPFVIAFIIIFNVETGIPANYGIRQRDLLYYLMFAGVVLPAQVTMDIFLLNCQELLHGWPLFDYVDFSRWRFKSRAMTWKGLEPNVDETLSPEVQSMDQLCFSAQFYFLNGVFSWGVFFVFLGITMELRQEYHPFADPLFILYGPFIFLTGLVIKEVTIAVAVETGLWHVEEEDGNSMRAKLAAKQKVRHAAAELQKWQNKQKKKRVREDGFAHTALIPVSVLTSESLQRKFLDFNLRWLLHEKFLSLFDDNSLEEYRPYLNKIYQELRQKKGLFKRLANSDSEAGDGSGLEIENADVLISPKSTSMAMWWLYRARRIIGLRSHIASVDSSELREFCFDCGSRENLEVETLMPLDILVLRYDKEKDQGFPSMDNLFQTLIPAEQWKTFYRIHQRFRTRCKDCIIRVALNAKADPVDVSDHSDVEGGIDKASVYLNETSKDIAIMWLLEARKTLKREAYGVPKLDFSSLLQKRSARPSAAHFTLKPRSPVRKDISSDSDSDIARKAIDENEKANQAIRGAFIIQKQRHMDALKARLATRHANNEKMLETRKLEVCIITNVRFSTVLTFYSRDCC